MDSIWPALGGVFAGVAALLYAFGAYGRLVRQDAGPDELRSLGNAIRTESMTFLSREYRLLAVFIGTLAGLLFVVNIPNATSHWLIAFSFLFGAATSALSGFLGVRAATMATVRTTACARRSTVEAMRVAFRGGVALAMFHSGIGAAALSLLFLAYFHSSLFTNDLGGRDLARLAVVLSGFSLGASARSLFTRVFCGVYTNTADVGAYLLRKFGSRASYEGSSSSAAFLEKIGDGVGRMAGAGADLFGSHAGALVACVLIGSVRGSVALMVFPFAVSALGSLASLFGSWLVRGRESAFDRQTLAAGKIGAAVLLISPLYFVAEAVLSGTAAPAEDLGLTPLRLALPCAVGVVGGLFLSSLGEYGTGMGRRPAERILKDSAAGTVGNLLSGMSAAMGSIAFPLLVIAFLVAVGFIAAADYGVALVALGMLSISGIHLAIDAFGPTIDGAAAIVGMSQEVGEVHPRMERLGAVARRATCMGKGYSTSSAAIVGLALTGAFRSVAGLENIHVGSPWVLAGLLIGVMVPFLFSSFALRAVGIAVRQLVHDFRGILALLERRTGFEYSKQVDRLTAVAVTRLALPGLAVVFVPVFVGFFSRSALGAMLLGAVVSGACLALFASNAGLLWDNAKRMIDQEQKLHPRSVERAAAAAVGQGVGDALAHTVGPGLSILVKLMPLLALVVSPLF